MIYATKSEITKPHPEIEEDSRTLGATYRARINHIPSSIRRTTPRIGRNRPSTITSDRAFSKPRRSRPKNEVYGTLNIAVRVTLLARFGIQRVLIAKHLHA